MAEQPTGNQQAGATAPVKLTVAEWTSLRDEWCREVTFRRHRIHTFAAWLSGGALAASAWLASEQAYTDPVRQIAISSVAFLIGVGGVLAVWQHKRLHNNAARVIARLNKGAGLYGTLLVGRAGGTRGTAWGTGLAGWEQYIHTGVLWVAFSLLIAAPALPTPSSARVVTTRLSGTPISWTQTESAPVSRARPSTTLTVAICLEALFFVACLAVVRRICAIVRSDVESETGLAGVEIARSGSAQENDAVEHDSWSLELRRRSHRR